MNRVLRTLKLCHGWDVLCEIDGKPVTLVFRDKPTEEQLAERMEAKAQQLVDEINVVAVGITPSDMAFEHLVDVTEQLCERVNAEWQVVSKTKPELASKVNRIIKGITADVADVADVGKQKGAG